MIANITITNPKARGNRITIDALLASIISSIIKLIPITLISVDSRSVSSTIASILFSDAESSDSSVVGPRPIPLAIDAFKFTIITVPFALITPLVGSKSFVSIIENIPLIWDGV